MNGALSSIFLAAPLLASAASLPMAFEPNVGQADAQVRYLARGDGYTLFLTSGEAVFRFDGKAPLRMSLAGAKPALPPRGLVELPGKVNCFLGKNPAHWRTGVPTFAKVAYDEVYPGVDLVYYGDSAGLEYDFIVAPRADPRRIALRFAGAGALEVGAGGELIVHSGSGTVRWRKPLLYQEAGGHRQPIGGGYEIRGPDTAGFRVGAYDRKRPLVIDPVLMYSTYLGGSGAENSTGIAANPRKSAVAADAAGNSYVTGTTESTGFPIAGAAQGVNGGGPDAFVVKLDSVGRVLFSTYLGGAGIERGLGIAVDSSGVVYVTGRTQSADFPVVGALQASLRGREDAFVAKLSAGGAALAYSTYLGGSSQDDGLAIAVDAGGNALVAGSTESLDFPVSAAFQPSHRGGVVDAYLLKLNPQGNAAVFSTYLGGTNFDSPEAVVLDSAGNAYIAGYTGSTDFPTAGPLQAALRGPADGFVAKFEPGGGVSYSTYLGGTGPDSIHAIAVDAAGCPYVAGMTQSADFPATAGAFQSSPRGGVDAFVAKLAAAGSSLAYATYLGGGKDTAEDLALAIAVDAGGSAYVTGTTTSSDFPLVEAFQRLMGGVRDAFVTALAPDGSSAVYSTFFGGSGLDYGYGIALDPSGDVVITGRTFSEDLPVPGAFQRNFGGQGDAFVAKIAARAPAGLLRAVPAASFRPGGGLPPESIASAFGSDLAPSVELAQAVPLPMTLAGTQVRVRDGPGTEPLAPLFFVAPAQINFLVPAGTAPGPATLTVLRNGQAVATAEMHVEAVAPGLFTANADGHGAPAAYATRLAPDGKPTYQMLFQCGAAPGSCTPVPIDLGGPGHQVVLTLFGTGIRGRSSLAAVEASILGPPLEVLYAGPQGDFVGLDQVNIRLPANPVARVVQDLRLVVDGRVANPVVINLQ